MTVHRHDDRPYEWVGDPSGRRATLTPDRTGLVDLDTDTEYTYGDLDSRASRVAGLLEQRGVSAGDRVAVVSRNRPELVDLYFATAKLGAVLAPLSHRLAPGELAGLLDDVAATVLVVESPFAATILEALDRVNAVPPHVLGVDAGKTGETTDANGDGSTAHEWDRLSAALPAAGARTETTGVALSDPHLLLHTGGSTGRPKEVVLTHGSIYWNSFNTIVSWGLRPDDVTPMVFPMFHTGGWNVLTIPFFHLGGTVAIAREFDPESVLAYVETAGATVLVAVPTVLRSLVQSERWESTDISSLRLVKSGGGPCREAIVEAFAERGVDLTQGYGLTECGPNNFAMPSGFPREKTDTVGVPALCVDTRVVDADGQECPPGTVGELELAWPGAADRYWQEPTETAETFGDWVSTGDLAVVDPEGYYRIVGRKKNMFVSGGENVYPPEVEAVLTDHPGIDEAIVVAVPDETWGEVGKAVLQGDDSLELAEIQAFLDGRLASYKIPTAVTFLEEMPTSGPGKIDRQAIEQRFGED